MGTNGPVRPSVGPRYAAGGATEPKRGPPADTQGLTAAPGAGGPSPPSPYGRFHAVRRVRVRGTGHAARRDRSARRDRLALLRHDVPRPAGTARRAVQPRQPGERRPAKGVGRFDRRVRQSDARQPGHPSGRPAGAHRAQARLRRHHRRPVHDRAQVPVRRDSRRPGRRGHRGGGGRLGRGVLADGRCADRHGGASLPRGGAAARPRLAPVDGGRAPYGDPRRGVLRDPPGRRQAGPPAHGPASTSVFAC